MKSGNVVSLMLLLLFSALCVGGSNAQAADAPKMTVQELHNQLGSPHLTVIDSRTGRDWVGSDRMIRGAVRGKSSEIALWAATLSKSRPLVIYCA